MIGYDVAGSGRNGSLGKLVLGHAGSGSSSESMATESQKGKILKKTKAVRDLALSTSVWSWISIVSFYASAGITVISILTNQNSIMRKQNEIMYKQIEIEKAIQEHGIKVFLGETK